MKNLFRLLAFGHLLTCIALLPLTLFLGILAAPILLAPVLWLPYLAIRIWNPRRKDIDLLRRTHTLGIGFSILFIAYGVYALDAAARSAAEGGGLLGGFGLIPLGAGILLLSLSLLSLWMSRRWPRGIEVNIPTRRTGSS